MDMKRILNLSWAEIAEICGFSSSASARNSYHNGSKIFKFGAYVARHYEAIIISYFQELKKHGNIESISQFKEQFKIMKCLNPKCEKEVTENELLLNNDRCPHCDWEHDRDILEDTDILTTFRLLDLER